MPVIGGRVFTDWGTGLYRLGDGSLPIGGRAFTDWGTGLYRSGFSFTPAGNQSVNRTVSKPRPSFRFASRAASTNRAEARTLKPAGRALEPRTTSTTRIARSA